jgi:hypothetical protein
MVSELSLAVAHTGQCAGIWRMRRVVLDGTDNMVYEKQHLCGRIEFAPNR